MPPPEKSVPNGSIASRSARYDSWRAPVGRGQLQVRGKPVSHVAHQPRTPAGSPRPSAPDGSGSTAWERRCRPEAGASLHRCRFTVGATVDDLEHAARSRPSCCATASRSAGSATRGTGTELRQRWQRKGRRRRWGWSAAAVDRGAHRRWCATARVYQGRCCAPPPTSHATVSTAAPGGS